MTTDRVGQAAPAFPVGGLAGQRGTRWTRRLLATARNLQSLGMPMIAWATQSVTSSASLTAGSVRLRRWQEIVGCAINHGAGSVEVGVHLASGQTVY